MTTKPEIYRIMYLSTAHLTKEAGEDMDAWSSMSNAYGGLVPTALTMTGKPECVALCMGYAIAHDCQYIMFDCDVDPIDDLPTFDW